MFMHSPLQMFLVFMLLVLVRGTSATPVTADDYHHDHPHPASPTHIWLPIVILFICTTLLSLLCCTSLRYYLHGVPRPRRHLPIHRLDISAPFEARVIMSVRPHDLEPGAFELSDFTSRGGFEDGDGAAPTVNDEGGVEEVEEGAGEGNTAAVVAGATTVTAAEHEEKERKEEKEEEKDAEKKEQK